MDAVINANMWAMTALFAFLVSIIYGALSACVYQNTNDLTNPLICISISFFSWLSLSARAKRIDKKIAEQIKLAQSVQEATDRLEYYAQKVKAEQLFEMDNLSAKELAEKVMEILLRGKAQVKIDIGYEDRCILDIVMPNGLTGVAIVKKTTTPLGIADVRAVYSLVINKRCQSGYLITNETFTHQALKWAHNKPIYLLDENGLNDLAQKAEVKWSPQENPLLDGDDYPT